MSFNGYHHIGLKVKDTEKSMEFYTKALGGKVTLTFHPGNDSSKNIYMVDLGGNAVIEILPGGNDAEEANARWAHVAVRTDDAKAAYDAAIKAGAVSRMEPKDVSLGPTYPACIAFVYGPDKEIIEFFQVK